MTLWGLIYGVHNLVLWVLVFALSSEERVQSWESEEEIVSSKLDLQSWDLEVLSLLVLWLVTIAVVIGQDTGESSKEAKSDDDLSD